MIARCNLGDDPAVAGVDLRLRIDEVRDKVRLPVQDGDRRLITGGLDP
jgi:hypothetical protein